MHTLKFLLFSFLLFLSFLFFVFVFVFVLLLLLLLLLFFRCKLFLFLPTRSLHPCSSPPTLPPSLRYYMSSYSTHVGPGPAPLCSSLSNNVKAP